MRSPWSNFSRVSEHLNLIRPKRLILQLPLLKTLVLISVLKGFFPLGKPYQIWNLYPSKTKFWKDLTRCQYVTILNQLWNYLLMSVENHLYLSLRQFGLKYHDIWLHQFWDFKMLVTTIKLNPEIRERDPRSLYSRDELASKRCYQ